MQTETERFAHRLKRARLSLDMSQVELAEASGTSQSAISMLESGDRNPSLVTVQRIASALDVSVSELMEDV